ncbi:hypothetical protein [Roseibium sp.]|uniref:hypothetical protein n=1 Tax=Roseibium sp. TaxID=1936156 RepID=UPI001B1CA5E6|nr:hypothetical protein [Roseibium sp.]MBO6860623.1 hypothetical protein [Roseibium sp.]
MSIPITIIIGLLGVLIGIWFQRRSWLLSIAEEVRVRETADASKLIDLIAETFDKRIAIQRAFLYSIGDEDRADYIDKYREAVIEYAEKINIVRSKLYFYFSYEEVLRYEQELHVRLVVNAEAISNLRNRYEELSSSGLSDNEVFRLNEDLSIISAKVFRYCQTLYVKVAKLEFGSLRTIHNWTDRSNDFVSSVKLLRRVLNI